MALVTFLEWTGLLPFLSQCLMTVLAVLVIGILQLHGLSLFLRGIVTFAALIYVIPILPDVLAVLVHMVALCTGDLVIHVMLFVHKLYRAFFVLCITLVFKLNLIGHLLLFSSNQDAHGQEEHTGKYDYQKGQKSLVHLYFHLLSSKFVNI